jgi:hypothetical protein
MEGSRRGPRCVARHQQGRVCCFQIPRRPNALLQKMGISALVENYVRGFVVVEERVLPSTRSTSVKAPRKSNPLVLSLH